MPAGAWTTIAVPAILLAIALALLMITVVRLRRAAARATELEQQLERSAANFTSTADEQAKLRRALEEALALAAARARQMDDLQRALTEEQSKTDTLGRNLAAKLATFDVVSSQIAQRDASISADDVDLHRQRHPEAEVHVYPAGHGFNCDQRDDFHRPSAELALDRTLGFLRRALHPAY